MTGFAVDVDELISCRNRLAGLRADAETIAALAEDANPEWYIWGLLGAPMAAVYWQVADDLHDHLRLMTTSLDEQVTSLDCTAEDYLATEQALERELERLGAGGVSGAVDPGQRGDSDVTNDAPPTSARTWSPGGMDVFRVETGGDLPAISNGIAAYSSAVEGDIGGVVTEVGTLAAHAVAYAADPLHWLISAGLGFLIDVVQPLEDLLGLVTGNPERMAGEIDKWTRVSGALGPLSEEIRAAATVGLVGWEGRTAEAAKARLHDFADGVAGLGGDVNQLAALMDIARSIMNLAQQLIIGLLAQLVEWLILTWSAAMAAAVPTAGASTAAAGAATTAQTAATTTRAVRFMDQVVRILTRVGEIVRKLQPARVNAAIGAFRPPGLRGNYGNIGAAQAAANFLTNPRSYGPGGVGVVGSIAAGVADLGGGMSDEDISARLDPDR